MYTMQNSAGQNLPLTMPTEHYAKKMLGLSAEIIREGIPDYGKNFKGDLVPASYTYVGDNATKYVEGEFTQAYRRIVTKQTQAQILEKHKEANYEIMTKELDSLGVTMFKQAFMLVVGILATYGILWATSLVFPVVLSYILTVVLGAAFIGFPVLYLVSTVKFFRNNRKQIKTLSLAAEPEPEYEPESKVGTLLKNENKKTRGKYTLPLLQYTIKPFELNPKYARTGKGPYSYGALTVLQYHYPYLFSVDDELINKKRIYMCVNCGHPTPVIDTNTVYNCINCNSKYKATNKEIHVLTVDHEYMIEEKLKLTATLTKLLQKTILECSVGNKDYLPAKGEFPLHKVLELTYKDLPEDKDMIPEPDAVIN